MTLLEPALKRIGVEPAEHPIFLRAGACLALVGAAAFAGLNTAETLFLKRVGVEFLPWALLLSSGLLVGSTGLLGRLLSATDRARTLPYVLAGIALALVPFGVLVRMETPWVYWALLLVARQVLALGLMAFWTTLGDLVTGRQAKRIFAPLAAGITLGGTVGSFGSDPIARLVGIDGLIAVCAGLLVMAAVLARGLRRARPRRLERGAGGEAPRSRARVPGVGLVALWRGHLLFRLLVVALLCGGALSPVLYFQFSWVADQATSGPGGEQELLALYAQFRGWLNVAMLGAQLWLSVRLYHRIGLPGSLALWPLVYLLGFVSLSISLGLGAGIASLGAGRIAEDGIGNAALRVLFNLFPESVRARASSLLEGPINRLGGMLGNGLVIGALQVGSARAVGIAAIPVAALWLLSALGLWRAYPSLLLEASADDRLRGAGADKAMMVDPGTIRALAPSLASEDPSVCRAAVELVEDAEPGVAVGVLCDALAKAPKASRPLLVESLHGMLEGVPPGALRSPSAVAALGRVLGESGDMSPEDRGDLVRVFAKLTGGEAASAPESQGSIAVFERAMRDRQAAVRLAAIAELQRRGRPPPGVRDLDSVVEGALRGKDVLMRRSARKELRAMLLASDPEDDDAWQGRLDLLAGRLTQRADRAETIEALALVARRHGRRLRECAVQALEWIDDRDPRVRAGVLAFAGHAGLVESAPRMVEALSSSDPGEVAGAREGLVALGPDAAQALLVGHAFGAARGRDAVVAVLEELEIDPETLQTMYHAQLSELRSTALLRAALEPGPAPRLLLRRLEERVVAGLGATLALVAVIEDDPRIVELERRLRRTLDARRRDLLIEALEALLPGGVRAELFPVLEAEDWEKRGKRVASQTGRDVPTREEAWHELAGDSDDLTRRLVAALGPRDLIPGAAGDVEDVGSIDDASHVPNPIDIAVRLQDVPAFDRLSTQQLVRVGEALSEARFGAGQTVYDEGEEGDGLYFVLEGELELSKAGKAIERLGPGSFFGELSTLDGAERASTAKAVGELRLLRLEREDLLSLMEDAPALAIGLSQFLSLRVRALQEQLQVVAGAAAS